MKTNAKTKKLWLLVGLAMLAVIGVWALWLYPQSARKMSQDKPAQYEEFKNKLNDALALFRKRAAAGDAKDEVEELRERVFGDSISR